MAHGKMRVCFFFFLEIDASLVLPYRPNEDIPIIQNEEIEYINKRPLLTSKKVENSKTITISISTKSTHLIEHRVTVPLAVNIDKHDIDNIV